MPKITTPLTALQITKAKPKDKEYNLADGQGLMLRIKPSGSKLWLFNYYRPYTKIRANFSLGVFPDVSLAMARDERAKARALLSQNSDPRDHRKEQIRQQQAALNDTLKYAVDQWMEIKRGKVTQDHALDIYRSFENFIFPALGHCPLKKLLPPMVIDVLRPVANKGSLDTVQRLTQRLNEVMEFALNTGLIEHNPLSGIGKAFKPPQKKHYQTLKPSELPELLAALKEATINHMTRQLIEWQLHTMVRPSEAAGTQWQEIDLEERLWIIPAERMKKKRPHTIPLSEQAIAILLELKPITGEKKHVFHSARTKSKHLNESTANVALKRMGFQGRLVAHGMRALASTTLNEREFDGDIIEVALAHVDKNEVRAAYNRAEYIERRRAMMTWWSNHIEQKKK
ncbi:integrase [Bermanella sp. 47_1433_sub80_T6]|nr:integrase [Bermanella sp. 47_1433_sub80_T6]